MKKNNWELLTMKRSLLPLLRCKNAVLNRWEQVYQTVNQRSYPISVQFPTGTRCNLFCKFCTERKGEVAKEYNYADLKSEQFIEILSKDGWHQALSSAGDLALYGWGEPLINSDYEKMFDYVTQTFPLLGISLSTNGVQFDKKWSEKFVKHKNTRINFSVNAATTETYRKLMGLDKFDQVIGNISNLSKYRKEMNAESPKISMSFVLTNENLNELSLFLDHAHMLSIKEVVVNNIMVLNDNVKQYAVDLNSSSVKNELKNVINKADTIGTELQFLNFPVIENFSFEQKIKKNESSLLCENKSGKIPPSPYRSITDCFSPWESFMISINGDVFPCCESVGNPEFSMGNIFENTFNEIWNGSGYHYVRSTVNTSNPPVICAACTKKKIINCS